MTQTIRVFTSQIQENLWFNACEITSANVAEFRKLPKGIGGKVPPLGSAAFSKALEFFDNYNTTVWAIFASSKQYQGNLFNIDLELYFSATTSLNSPFASHMGI